MKRLYQLIIIYAAICSCEYSVAQSVFQKDTLRVDSAILYTKPVNDFIAVSTKFALLTPDQGVLGLDEAYVDEVVLYQACKEVFPKNKYEALRKERNMFVDFYFNNSGNVIGLSFRVNKNTVVLPDELLGLQQILERNIHITLPPSLKVVKGVKLLRYNVLFDRLYMYKPFSAQLDTLHTDWVNNDIGLFHTLEKLDKNNPEEFEYFFHQFKYQRGPDSLGFGWMHYSPGKGAGYISVQADFYYYRGKIVTYILSARLPRRPDLKEKYKQLYAKLLPLDSGLSCYYKYHEANILKPLKEYKSIGPNKHIPLQLLKYMSPLSGTMYGYAGGLPVSELYNRSEFNNTKDDLTDEQVVALMYSINPASRLTAIEYYYRNKTRFKNQSRIEDWIRRVYNETPDVETISGCIVTRGRPQKLVENFLQWKVK